MNKDIIKEHQCLPIKMVGDTLIVGFVNASKQDGLREKLKVDFEAVMISERTFDHNYSFLFGADDEDEQIDDSFFAEQIIAGFQQEDEKADNVRKILSKIEKEKKEIEAQQKKKKLVAAGDDNSLEQLIDSFVREAIEIKASDIHIETEVTSSLMP
jgi:type II secretory ATPase GspE/PulE/Tfp pilus assembly ATPase PilB-like protein